MFNNFKNNLENIKENFACGICLLPLNEARKCPNCSFMACKKCFIVIILLIFYRIYLIEGNLFVIMEIALHANRN